MDVAELPPPEVKPPSRRSATPQARAAAARRDPSDPGAPRGPAPVVAAAERGATAQAGRSASRSSGPRLSSTVAGPSSVSVPLGSTLAAAPTARAPAARAGSGDGDGFKPVAEIYISKFPEKIFVPDGEEFYPTEAKRMGIEGAVKLKIGIDENGNVVRVKVLTSAPATGSTKPRPRRCGGPSSSRRSPATAARSRST